MKYTVHVATFNNEFGSLARGYYKEIFENVKMADISFPDPYVNSALEATYLLMNRNVYVFLIFAHPQNSSERDRIKEITGRGLCEPLASVHLTGFRGLAAEAHFSVHPEFAKHRDQLRKAGKSFIRWIFSRERDDEPGIPFVTTLVGMIATYNFAAIVFIKELGFEPVTVLKHSMYNRVKEKYCNLKVLKLESDRYDNGY